MKAIDKNVPMPPAAGKGGGPRKYPFHEMVVGDSFIAGETYDDGERVKAAGVSFGKKKGIKFSIRKTLEGWRCWRIM